MPFVPGDRYRMLTEGQIPEQVTITRTHLRGYGASSYLARQLTVALVPRGRQGAAYCYALPDIMSSIAEYLAKPRIRATTRQILEYICAELRPQVQNVIEISFGDAGDPELKRLCLSVIRSKAVFDRHLSEAKSAIALIQGRRS